MGTVRKPRCSLTTCETVAEYFCDFCHVKLCPSHVIFVEVKPDIWEINHLCRKCLSKFKKSKEIELVKEGKM